MTTSTSSIRDSGDDFTLNAGCDSVRSTSVTRLDSRRVFMVCDLPATFVRFRLPLAKQFVRLGHRLSVVVSFEDRESIDVIRSIGADVFVVPMNRTGVNPFSDIRYYRALRTLFEREKPDVVFAYQAKAAVYASMAARVVPTCKRHVLFPGLGYLFGKSKGWKSKLVRRIAVRLYRRGFHDVDTAFFQNPDDQETLEKVRIFDDSVQRRIVSGSGVPLDAFGFSKPVIQPVRFLFVGRMLKEKGIVEFVSAATRIRARYGENVEFEMVGALDSNPSSIGKKDIQQWAKENIVDYPGSVRDVRPHLAKASVFVLPSYYMEGTPRSILEAMSMGRPVITTDSRGCRETVEEQRNGILVIPKSVDSLEEAMKYFVENPHRIAEMGLESRRIAEERYDVRKVVAEMTSIMGLDQIVSG